ncbi:Gfo/Idh/MocA family oxidoreductase [Ruixingdingia sedimenti]|uniref:Inositol 2-dehydrogenase n=1 Tax=Ruixingdingia sedimenti TaxID=3073604 RepID=A0ABU1FAN1_9RHOB|nr:Gfo/Idh/MocA family oxidoreductase [Xinfangfangia sp. LG-4]MDR5653499.1 Gfo/Idh/MocA family oxidoreductase [Xinfangfangia sp. LG-4]
MSYGIGILGAGVMGSDHARILASQVAGAHLVAVFDPDRARAEASAGANGARRVHARGIDLIDDPEVEAVLIASPDATHAEFVLACLARGKPVLCEKPLAASAAECLQLIEAETKLGRRLIQVGFMRRFDPFYGDLRAGLEQGGLGPVLLAHCVHRVATVPGYFQADMSITNAAVHEFDILRWLLGQEIAAVQVMRSRRKSTATLRDPLMIVLETDQGVVADVEAYMSAAYGYDIRTEVVCEEGTAELARPQPAAFRRNGSVAAAYPADWRGRFADAYRLQLQGWVNGVRSGVPAGASAWDGYLATIIADAALKSLNEGGRVAIPAATRPALYR